MAEVAIRDLAEVDDLRSALELFERIWGAEDRMFAVEVLRAVATHGGAILGAFLDDRMVGAQVAFLGRDDGELLLHSHVTGVEPTLQHEGIGSALKWAQRDWALERGIELITWTFDPMISRNAYLNLRKLGASARRFRRDFYGRMDDDINVGERSDRLEITWRLRDPRVEGAAAGGPVARDAEGAAVLLD
ncbi:MAG TPA: GNAT family N-acetyltransferase, partial [Actinomycetota bacterium]